MQVVNFKLLFSLQNWLLDNLVVPVAAQFGMREEYAYLKDSIACFPTGLRFLLKVRMHG
jgi:ubiquinone/menaquinone biosynthesis C-methylase UbiE